ncbi:MAG: hypothetical protein KJO31_03005 [Gammaproteobacteria bacterium]|nr:hypothetical protein [Gammaproteobacteria bacterium]
MLGHYLEFSVRTSDILESLAFYKSLGFAEQESGDVWPHRYAVVSDGNLCIGLHEAEIASPALTFVQADLAKRARSMADHGFEFTIIKVDLEEFNQLGLQDRDRNNIWMLEARTFSPPDESIDNSVCGGWFEVTLPTRDALRGGRFWAPLAPKLLELREEPTTHMRFDAGGVSLGLSESIALESPSLCFKCPDKSLLASVIDLQGIVHKEFPGFEGAFLELKAPEGTKLFVFDSDFLGEAYEVDESED